MFRLLVAIVRALLGTTPSAVSVRWYRTGIDRRREIERLRNGLREKSVVANDRPPPHSSPDS
ncbi:MULTISPECIES: hypothetical protein [Haladaptatus]|uniref:hypothetical protein n=1 Tax=Haladaptatus TaxID=367188 RepID=UPI0015C58225|nr:MULTISPECIES: hypothetical protein [Haladaptatus]